MPWEQTLNASLVDPRSDLFALGATFYHLVTGRVPFPGKDVAEVARLKDEGDFAPARSFNPSLPRSVDTILAKLLARMPKDRFQNAAQLIDVLAASGLAAEKSVSSPLSDTDLPPSATRPDLKASRGPGDPSADEPVWSIRFRDGDAWRKGKGRTSDVLRWFEDGLLPDEFYLARAGNRTCRHFRTYPEFRDLKRNHEVCPPAVRKRFRFFGR
jgi:serine/threonine protein kinase